MAGIFTILLGASTWALQDSAKEPQLGVELVETTGLDDHVIAGLQKEVESIYRSAGVAIRWLEESPPETAPHLARVYLMDVLPGSLHSRLRAFDANGAPPMALGLGNEKGVSGAVLYVSRKGVAARATNGGLVEPEPEALARALGRVIAHELAHRFVQREHTRRGVLKADFGGADLVGDGSWARFTKREAKRLRAVAISAPGELP